MTKGSGSGTVETIYRFRVHWSADAVALKRGSLGALSRRSAGPLW